MIGGGGGGEKGCWWYISYRNVNKFLSHSPSLPSILEMLLMTAELGSLPGTIIVVIALSI